jgi:hypothetical protein
LPTKGQTYKKPSQQIAAKSMSVAMTPILFIRGIVIMVEVANIRLRTPLKIDISRYRER